MSRPASPERPESKQRPPVVIHDRRRIDPDTLQLREPEKAKHEDEERNKGPGRESGGHLLGDTDRTAALEEQLAERTADLQRLKAEYDNYRKRMQRDQLAVREGALANVLTALLPVLDTVDQAREHGEFTGGLKAVAGQLESQLATLGLQSVGIQGEPFDPAQHEALTHERTADVDRPICTAVLRRGYRVGEHLLRPAQVRVGEPPAQAADIRRPEDSALG
ncbi:nucleotide exchange factor GrpE [Kitasatospora sp. MAP5-34]|uniref:nucleotide exchange factor GrpE n=1 Tax=Kitasatospora sp. MAP5-34 TaxID=3035102 RepID=UPI00247645EC|nr:nucleotide exchange factor GrpE [Kitasatospora sp. MAP5-34]MDH6580494.1 molecular chaperone GrpE [Kitasatospora sp. MAP5-34]